MSDSLAALAAAEAAIRRDPADAAAWTNKGAALHSLARYDEALVACDRAIQLSPTLAVAWNNKANVLQGLARFDEALVACDRAIELNSTRADGWYSRGAALYGLGRFSDALAALVRGIELNPTDASAWTGKGMMLAALGRFDEEFVAYERALGLNPAYALAWYNKGCALGRLGRFSEALLAFERTLELNPAHAGAWYNKANTLRGLDRFNEALHAFDRAIEANSKDANLWIGKGLALARLGRFNQALVAYDRAIELNPTLASAWDSKGCALYGLASFSEALAAHNHALELNPTGAMAWNNKGAALRRLGQLSEALVACDRAIELDPTLSLAWYNKGFALASLGRWDETTQAFYRFCHLTKTILPDDLAYLLRHFSERIDAPLFVLRLLREHAALDTFVAWAELRDGALERGSVAQSTLSAIAESKILSKSDRLKYRGLINFALGDPFEAHALLDRVDNLDDTDLQAQYYFARAAEAFSHEEAPSIRKFALGRARELAQSPLPHSPRNLYYAGLLLIEEADLPAAERCLASLAVEGDLPAQYLRMWVLHQQARTEERNAQIALILKRERELWLKGAAGGFLTHLPEFDLETPAAELELAIALRLHAREISGAVRCLHDYLHDHELSTGALPKAWRFVDEAARAAQPGLAEWRFATRIAQRGPAAKPAQLAALRTELTKKFSVEELRDLDEITTPKATEDKLAHWIQNNKNHPTQDYGALLLYCYLRERLEPLTLVLLTYYLHLTAGQQRNVTRNAQFAGAAAAAFGTLVTGLLKEQLWFSLSVASSLAAGLNFISSKLTEAVKAASRNEDLSFAAFEADFLERSAELHTRLGQAFYKLHPIEEFVRHSRPRGY